MQSSQTYEQRLPRVLLSDQQPRHMQFTSSNILIEAFAAGTLSTMNDDILRWRTEAHLGWCPNSLDTVQARFVISKTRHVVLSRIDEAAASTIVRFAVLGVALEPIRRYLQA